MPNIDMQKVKTYSVAKRKSKVKSAEFAKKGKKGASFAEFYDSLPDILAAKDFKELVNAIVAARAKSKPVLFLMGAHIIKCGLNPLLIDLVEKKIVTHIALNGAGVIHDVEIAMIGKTSEDVADALKDGSFGMAKEPADFINMAAVKAALKDAGMGAQIAAEVQKSRLPHKYLSILNAAAKNETPVTVHVAIGADIIHQHPSCDGGAVGKASLEDFRILADSVSRLGNGGVVLNIGSAVMLPEVFLKALNTARNLGRSVKDFTTANFDMIRHYRPSENILRRPTLAGGRAISITGHHELMLPLLYQAIIEKVDK